ncbi:MAG: hypothetical protein L6W00_29645 [Lentisphaeria bacterium]|nr:MAG: hypothetical protein L6W00_29645 [Lentisphaeria bacterium]
MFREINPESSATPCVLPFFAGTGPLDHLDGGHGLFSDLDFSHSRASLLRGALEESRSTSAKRWRCWRSRTVR